MVHLCRVKMSALPVENDTTMVNGTWCSTNMKVGTFTFMWNIKNFSFLGSTVGDKLKSLPFSGPQNPKQKWCLRVHPKGADETSKEFVSLYLLLVMSTKVTLRAKFKFAILDNNREWRNVMESSQVFKFTQGKDWGYKKFVKRSVLMDPDSTLISDDRLTIMCEIKIVGPTVSRAGKICHHPQPVPACSMGSDLGDLLLQNLGTDVKIVCKGEAEIYAHKIILMARSNYFKSAFNHNGFHQVKEIDARDIDKDVMEELLVYIYSGKCTKLETMDSELYIGAQKYQLERLQILCENSMIDKITVCNVPTYYLFADRHGAPLLKQKALEQIADFYATVSKTKQWTELMKAVGPSLLVDLNPLLEKIAAEPMKKQKKKGDEPPSAGQPPSKRRKKDTPPKQ